MPRVIAIRFSESSASIVAPASQSWLVDNYVVMLLLLMFVAAVVAAVVAAAVVAAVALALAVAVAAALVGLHLPGSLAVHVAPFHFLQRFHCTCQNLIKEGICPCKQSPISL